MPTVKLTCLRQDHIDSNTGAIYPLYCGFSTASILDGVAAAPAYTELSPHQSIAAKVRKKPAEDWQRPISLPRVNAIASVFSDASKIMPNPVLLAENVSVNGLVSVAPLATPGGQPTGLYEVSLTTGGVQDPLWILDGQHRIRGLAASARSTAPLPFVLLAKEGANSYSPSQFAEIFAQVTTEAEDLRPEHREWLSYAFELGKYSATNASAGVNAKSFATAVDLCATPGSPGHPRPFYNGVRFNPFPPTAPTAASGGFGRTCQELASALKAGYFGQPIVGTALTPVQLAEQISGAYVALVAKVANPNTSVFFASGTHEMRVVQDAFLRGVLTHLRTHGAPGPSGVFQTWSDLLDALKFASTSWDFTPWVRSLSGPAQSESTRIALAVFAELFKSGALPAPAIQGGASPTIVDVLKGAGGSVIVEASPVTASGAPSRVGRSTQAFPLSGSYTVNLASGQSHVRVRIGSKNVARVELHVSSGVGGIPSRLGTQWVSTSSFSPPFTLHVRSHLFGGVEQVLDLSVT